MRESATERLASLSSSLSCVSHARASLVPHPRGLNHGARFRVGLPEPIRLRGSHNLFFTAFEALRVDFDRPVIALGSMNSYIAEYAYQIMLSEDGSQELLSFPPPARQRPQPLLIRHTFTSVRSSERGSLKWESWTSTSGIFQPASCHSLQSSASSSKNSVSSRSAPTGTKSWRTY